MFSEHSSKPADYCVRETWVLLINQSESTFSEQISFLKRGLNKVLTGLQIQAEDSQQVSHRCPFTYSKIPILRPPLGLSKSGLKDHFLTVPKVVSNKRYTCVEKEEKNNFNFTNKVLNGQDVLILGGLNSGISLYIT